MGYRLRMSAEIYEWLAELRDSDPPAAALTTQVLAALADQGDRLGPTLVTTADSRLHPEELPSAMDWRYQAGLESLTGIRRQVARAATLRKDLEQQLAEPEPSPALAEQLAEAREAEQRLVEACHQEQLRVDTFRARKEVLNAALVGAQAGQVLDPAGAAARLYEIVSWIEPELELEPPAEGLMVLRPGAPADSGIRILFAVEPPGTALLIAVLEGADAIRDHHREAVLLASEALREARSGQAPEAPPHEFADARSFLEEFVR
jgi:hypothetical protein